MGFHLSFLHSYHPIPCTPVVSNMKFEKCKTVRFELLVRWQQRTRSPYCHIEIVCLQHHSNGSLRGRLQTGNFDVGGGGGGGGGGVQARDAIRCTEQKNGVRTATTFDMNDVSHSDVILFGDAPLKATCILHI